MIVTKDGIYTFTKINGKLGIEVLFDGSKDLHFEFEDERRINANRFGYR